MTVTTPRPRWAPRDYAAAAEEIAAGLVHEGPHLELKQEMISNTDLAKQICAFSKNGGVIVIGVPEDKATGRATGIKPIPMQG